MPHERVQVDLVDDREHRALVEQLLDVLRSPVADADGLDEPLLLRVHECSPDFLAGLRTADGRVHEVQVEVLLLGSFERGLQITQGFVVCRIPAQLGGEKDFGSGSVGELCGVSKIRMTSLSEEGIAGPSPGGIPPLSHDARSRTETANGLFTSRPTSLTEPFIQPSSTLRLVLVPLGRVDVPVSGVQSVLDRLIRLFPGHLVYSQPQLWDRCSIVELNVSGMSAGMVQP